jgi:hypothetical protein
MKYLVLVLVLFSLSGCYEDVDVTIHQPGVYKGKVDQHALSAFEREVVLEKRFKQVQTDR